MAPTKPKNKSQKDKAKARARAAAAQPSNVNVRELLNSASAMLEVGDIENAARTAKSAHKAIGEDGKLAGAALSLLGHINVELGEIDAARQLFLAAVSKDEDGTLPEDVAGGPEKFLWLAQLSEEGGQDSVSWYDRGASALRLQIQTLSTELEKRPHGKEQQEALITEKKRRLAAILCAVAEVYMTDLSWEEDAEQRCEALITEAIMLASELPDTWQTVANVRISQTRVDEAKEALRRSMALWEQLEPEDPNVPQFPTRVSLVRLLIEVGMEEKAIDVAERLIIEDDQAVEVWYLSGYGRYLLGEKIKNGEVQAPEGETWQDIWRLSRKYLAQCLRTYAAIDYEDERLGAHAQELLDSIRGELGTVGAEDDEVWEDTDVEEDEDEEMN